MISTVGSVVWKLRHNRLSRKLSRSYFEIGGEAWSPPVPPPNLNYNQELPQTIDEYRERFLSSARDRELPFLRTLVDLEETSTTLDFGCGLGRLATAFHDAGAEIGTYLGWEPEASALVWLKSAYSDLSERFVFAGQPLRPALNYVTHVGPDTSSGLRGAVPSAEEWTSFIGNRTPNLIVSQSVFTHMWPEDVVEVLKLLASVSAIGGVMVHTWLVIDEVADAALKVGAADRRLPYSVNGVRTYSNKNPLLTTAYPIDLMMDVYRTAGVPVDDVLFGSWAGRGNDFSYQDVVVSRL